MHLILQRNHWYIVKAFQSQSTYMIVSLIVWVYVEEYNSIRLSKLFTTINSCDFFQFSWIMYIRMPFHIYYGEIKTQIVQVKLLKDEIVFNNFRSKFLFHINTTIKENKVFYI